MMQSPSSIPHSRIKRVNCFEELIHTPFVDGINALCWERTLSGDFSEVVRQFGNRDGVTNLDEDLLKSLPLSATGRMAIDTMLRDFQMLAEQELSPVLNLIHQYPRDESAAAVPTDVYSFHADSAPVEADTYLCTYYGPCSEGLRNEEAQRRIDQPETRAQLLQLFGGADDEHFRAFLQENCYDLHYAPLPAARPYSFGIGNLWRIATAWPGSSVPPCIHRAPENLPGSPPRLLLIC